MGYRFKVTIRDKGKERYCHIDKDSFVIGRGKDADVQLPSDLISREQVRVTYEDGEVWIHELGSSNGTWLDRKLLANRKKIQYHAGDTLSLGSQEGPFLKIEYFTQDDVIEIEEEEEAQIWAAPKKAAGAESIPVPPVIKKTSPAPIPQLPKEKLSVVPPMPDDQILQIKNDGERKLFQQIRQLLGSEADEIRNACLEEANRVKKNAEEYSLRHYREARDKAERLLKEAEGMVAKKMAELKAFEVENHKKLDIIRQNHGKYERAVMELKNAEATLKKRIAEMESHIQFEEVRIAGEVQDHEAMKAQFQQDREYLDSKIEEQALDERRFKAQMETELLEARAKVAQLTTEATEAQTLRNTLEPQVNQLKIEKFEVEQKLADLSIEHRKESLAYDHLKTEHNDLKAELEKAKLSLEDTIKEIESQKSGLEIFRKEIEENQAQAHSFLRTAEAKADGIIHEAQQKVVELEQRRSHLSEEVEAEYQKLKKDQEAMIHKLEHKKGELVKEIERIAVTAHEEYHRTINQGKTEAEEIRQKATSEIQDLKTQAELEIANKKSAADQALADHKAQGEKYIEDGKARAQHLMEQAQMELIKERSQFLHEMSQLEVKKKNIQDDIDHAMLEKEKIIEEGRTRARELLADTERNSSDLRRQVIESAQVEAKGIIGRAEVEYKDSKARQQKALAEHKHAEMMSIKEMKAKAEADWNDTRMERAKSVSTNLYALIASEMYKSRGKMMDETFIDTFSKELKEVVVDTMLDRTGPDSDKLQQILKTSEDAKNKEKRFWKKLQITAGASIALVLIVLIFPQVLLAPRDAIVSAFSKKETNNSDHFLEKVKEARIKAVYNPATTPDFKTSYVDNVLYTTSYLEQYNGQAFQDKWILELNDYFIKNLDVKDTTIIKFVSLETSLIKELAELKYRIDAQNPSPGIAEMRVKESEFQQKLADIFADQTKVPRYYDYQKKFWNEFHHPRRPASQP